MEKNNVKFDGYSLIVNGKRKILIGGEFHYFRTPRELWEDRLLKMKQSGCNLLTTYIPWNFHEENQGTLNWEGDRDLDYFLKLTKKYGLFVIIKPGPYICAEWDFGGFPHWLLEKDIPLRLPDPNYLEIVKNWYNEVAKIIKPHLITKGGNILLIQVENEYDHLIMFTDLVENNEVAKTYLLTLLKFIRESGIDIPAFTNEGSCILGTEIINTHTYYPNIPWIWMWEFNDFDRKIEEGRLIQADKPLMILELESGWFAQFGKPLYDVETELTEAITKTIMAYGTSVINYYMFVGGTSFGHWPAKGDFGGIGICNTFDFGGSPVREWGEIHEKYHYIRNHAYFLDSFPEIITEGETTYKDIDFYKGGEEISRVYRSHVEKYDSFKDSYENVKIMQRKSSIGSIVLVRNLEKENKEIQIGFHSKLAHQRIHFPEKKLKLIPYSSLLLPVDFYIGRDLQIIYSTSELIAKKVIKEHEYIILKGDKSMLGEMVIHALEKIEKVEGTIKCSNYLDKFKKINYSHNKIIVFKTGKYVFIILPQEEAKKLWIEDDFIMISDFYYLQQMKKKREGIDFNFQVKAKKGKQKNIIWSKKKLKQIMIERKKIKLEKSFNSGHAFSFPFNERSEHKIIWSDDWRYCSDTKEKENDFNDKPWSVIDNKTPLEKAKLFKHGYFWYRQEFNLPSNYSEVKIKLNSNEMDRFTVYINGKFRWIGIGSPDLDITELVKKGKNRIAISYENAFHTKAHPHEGPIKKMSGMYYPVVITAKTEQGKEDYEIPNWKIQEGLTGVKKGYDKNDFDDSQWIKIPESKKYVFEEDTSNIIWLRRGFIYEKERHWDKPLYINIKKVSDRCFIYINGFYLGKYEDVGPQHKFYIPENLLQKKNVLTLTIEGPGFHPVKGFGFLPPKLEEPEFGFYYEAKDVNVNIQF